MSVIKYFFKIMVMFIMPMLAFAQISMTSPSSIQRVSLKVDLFMSSTCQHCKKADLFFTDLAHKNSWLTVKRYYIDKDRKALEQFNQQLHDKNLTNFSVPAMFFCGTYWAGFEDPSTSGKSLIRALDYCHQQVVQQGTLTPTTIDLIQKWGMAAQYQLSPNDKTSPLILVPMLALIDALGPCSLFGIMAFFAFLWLYPSHRAFQLRLGLVLIACFGIVHYIQMVDATFYYHWISKLRIAMLVTGILLLLMVFRELQSKKTKLQHQPHALIYFVAMVAIFSIQMQQGCPFNINFVFEQWLIQQSFTNYVRGLYQFFYMLIYLLPLALVILFYWFFGRSNRILSWQPCLQNTAYLLLSTIGLLLIMQPPLLGNLMTSIIVFILAIGVGKYLTGKT